MGKIIVPPKLGLYDKSKATLRNRLSKVKFLIIYVYLWKVIYGKILIQGRQKSIC